MKTKIAIGCILAFFLVTVAPSIPAVEFNTLVKTKNTNDVLISMISDGSRRVYVDPHLCFSKANLPAFNQALRHLSDAEDKQILQHIIALIHKKGTVDSTDIRTIAEMLNLDHRAFYSGSVVANGDTGQGSVFPFTLLANMLANPQKHAGVYAGPILFGSWSAQAGEHHFGRCVVNGQTIVNGSNSGMVVGGFGDYGYGGDAGQFFFEGVFVFISVYNS